jgi:hypothetical protein
VARLVVCAGRVVSICYLWRPRLFWVQFATGPREQRKVHARTRNVRVEEWCSWWAGTAKQGRQKRGGTADPTHVRRQSKVRRAQQLVVILQPGIS